MAWPRSRSPWKPRLTCLSFFSPGTIGEERAIDALKRGAADYVLKTHLTRLAPAVVRAVRESASRKALRIARTD